MHKLNRDQDRRDEILKPFFEIANKERARYGLAGDEYCGGVRSYEGLTVEALEDLIEEGFVDLDDCQNNSPTVREFLEFARERPMSVFFHGYAVHKNRDDYRVTIEGLSCPTGHAHKTQAFKDAWKAIGRSADEKSVTRLWWD